MSPRSHSVLLIILLSQAFRKEAIYRKLLESRRDHARTRHSLRIMDRDLRRSERIAALFGRFWSQVSVSLA